ncbi:hypothetical protein HanPI659440_Chr00c21g0734811 [Helianthus annuus]|nr:hypothetical protein HanPI659440_Chr00c21g0734811 [Helianthus annuus]
MVSEQISQLGPVLAVFMNTQLQILGEGFIEFVVIILVLSNLIKHLNAFLHKILPDNLENLVLLKHFTRDVEWQVIRVHHTLHEPKIKWSPLRHKKDRLELQLSFNREVFHSQMFFPVIGQALVESSVFFLGDLFRFAKPDRFLFVDKLPLMRNLLDLLLLALLFLFLFVNFLNVTFLFFFRLLIFIVAYLFLGCFFGP